MKKPAHENENVSRLKRRYTYKKPHSTFHVFHLVANSESCYYNQT